MLQIQTGCCLPLFLNNVTDDICQVLPTFTDKLCVSFQQSYIINQNITATATGKGRATLKV